MRSHTVLPNPSGIAARSDIPRSAILLLQVALLDSLINISATAGDEGSTARQLLWGALGLLAALHVVTSRLFSRDRRFSFGGWPVALLLGYVFASALWSVTRTSTLKRAIVLTFLIAVCAISAGAWDSAWRKDRFSKLLATPMAWLVGMALLLTVLVPGRAFTELGWRGVSGQKNEAGQMMAMTVLLLCYGACHDRLGKRLRMALLALAFGFLLLSRSTTALLGLLFCIGMTELVTLRSSLRRLGSWRLAVMGGVLAASALLYFAYQLELLPSAASLYSRTLAAFGKSETFTGRTAIWQLVLGESRFHNRWIGGGFGGFWVGRNSISGYVVVGDDLYPGQAHNGYLDVYNDLGILGLALLAAVLVAALYRVARLFALRHPEARLHLGILFFCLFLNLGESTFFRNTVFMNIIFMASLVRTSSVLAQARHVRQSVDSARQWTRP